MNSAPKGPSAFTKMRQAYWEAKQSFNKATGQREDIHVVSSDRELDTKLDLLRAADSSFNDLLAVVLEYRGALLDLVESQKSFGLALVEYGTKDGTAAGKVMLMSGKAVSKSAHRHSELETHLMNVFYEVQTFQFKATSDALQKVAKMERARRAYRSGLMWLRDASEDLDPDVGKKVRNFKKVQQHIKRLKIEFDRVKLETMQKIDLLLLSRANLFSLNLAPYCQSFKKACRNSSLRMNHTLEIIPQCLSYEFVALKELNQYSKVLMEAIQQQRSSGPASGDQGKSKARPENLKMAGGTVLIDLNDGREKNQSSERALCRKIDGASSEYSKDLPLINLEDCRPSYVNELSVINFDDTFRALIDSVPQGSADEDSSRDLCFWSLIRSHEQTSKLLEADNPVLRTSDLILPEQPSTTSSESKWNTILLQFDPFLGEMLNPKSDAPCSESC